MRSRSSPTGSFPWNDSGFTLIEVLVALTILSISLAVLLSIFTQGLDRAGESRNEAAARALAQSLLAQAEIVPDPSMGSSNGRSNNLMWNLRVAPYGSTADIAAWQESVAEITATVSWRGERRTRSISISTLRLLPKPGGGDNQ
jgi:general secretion pathway protein I